MDYGLYITVGSVVVGMASAVYGIRMAKLAQKYRQGWLDAEKERDVINGRLGSTEAALRQRNKRFNELDMDYAALQRSERTTRGNLTKAKATIATLRSQIGGGE